MLKPKGQRVCRFCKRRNPEVTFKKKAHKIPYSLGNKAYLWDQECDSCNRVFSRFESDLGSFLGFSRTQFDIKGGSNTPIFSSGDSNVEAVRFNSDFMLLHRKDMSKGMTFDVEKAQYVVDISRRPHVPAYVYNAFLKIALSVLPDCDVPGYYFAYKYILSSGKYDSVIGPRKVIIAESNYGYEAPIAVLYKRRNNDFRFPLHLLSLYVRNFMFQISFPFHISEVRRRSFGVIELHTPYLDFTTVTPEPFEIKRKEVDLHSTELFVPEKEDLIIQMDRKDMENAVVAQLEPNFVDNLLKLAKRFERTDMLRQQTCGTVGECGFDSLDDSVAPCPYTVE
ncbi:MAG TPA: hypothetical protein VFE32_00710 [Puia sp.]|jgi:hypothetical protein|nr:hypothetical protein [Puia sp.]